MQEENKENQSETPVKKGLIKRMGILNIIFGALFFATLIAVVAGFAYQYRNIPTSKWGHYCVPTPWVGDGVVINKVKCGWAKMLLPDHATRKNKYFYTPYIGVELGECNGSGVMIFSFRNEENRKVGEDMQLRYRNGQFIPLNKTFYKSDGKLAFIYFGEEASNVESYDSLVEYERHFMDVKGKLKIFVVKYVTDEEQRKEQPLIRTLGQSTVPKEISVVEE